MVGIVLDTVFPIERGDDWQIKIALFQSEKSFGYALIKGEELNDLPKGPDSINIQQMAIMLDLVEDSFEACRFIIP